MTRAGAADTSTEPSTSQAEGAKREGEPGPASAPPLVARGKSDGTSVTTTEIDREKTAAEDGHAPPHSEPPNEPSQENKQNENQRAPTKMGTNLYDVSWSLEEQNTLEDGLRTYAEGAYESLWRYVKIAAKLPAKGVRDVALRVRWMKRKRAGEKTGAKRRKASGANGAGAGAAAGPGPEKKTKKAGEKGAGAEARRRAAQGARGAPTQHNSAGAGRPRSVFSMPMPGSAAAQNGLGPADGMGAGHPGARGGAGHLLGGRVHGAPPGYGAMGGSQSQSHGMGTGVFPVPGVPGYAHQPPGMPPGMYPHAYPHAGMPPGLPPGPNAAAGSPAPPRGGGPHPHPSAHVLHPPPPAVPAGALEAHGGCEITAGVGAIDRRLYGQLVSNGVIIARLRDDDDRRADANDFSNDLSNGADASLPRRVSSGNPSASSQTTLLSTNERLALLAEFRDALLDITESMRVAPGIMQRMPPLPVALDGALASALLPPPKTFLVSSRFGEQRGARSPMTFVPPTEVPTVPNGALPNGALPNGARAAKAPGASARMKSLQKQSSKKKDAARVSGKRAPKGAAAAPRANKKK